MSKAKVKPEIVAEAESAVRYFSQMIIAHTEMGKLIQFNLDEAQKMLDKLKPKTDGTI